MSASTSKWTAQGIQAVGSDIEDAGGWGSYGTPAPGPSGVQRKVRYIDCTSVSMASAIQYKVMHIPANTIVSNVAIVNIAADNITWGVGDSAAATTFLTTVNTSDIQVQSAGGKAKAYTTANEICVTPSNTAAAFKGFVMADFARAATTGQN